MHLTTHILPDKRQSVPSAFGMQYGDAAIVGDDATMSAMAINRVLIGRFPHQNVALNCSTTANLKPKLSNDFNV